MKGTLLDAVFDVFFVLLGKIKRHGVGHIRPAAGVPVGVCVAVAIKMTIALGSRGAGRAALAGQSRGDGIFDLPQDWIAKFIVNGRNINARSMTHRMAAKRESREMTAY